MSRWWRAYDDAINDPKLLRLSDEMFRAWFTLLCIASKNDGVLPPATDIALTLRMKPAKVAEWITKLHAAILLDKTETGFAPHNWNGRQYKSDVSTERVKQFRKRQRNVSSAVSETPPETDTEADTDQNKKESDWPEDFQDQFWEAYPHKVGKGAALQKLADARKVVGWLVLLAGLERYKQSKPSDRPWCNPATWLSEGRWDDQPAETAPSVSEKIDYETAVRMYAKTGVWSKYAPCGEPGQPNCTVPAELLEKYGLLPDGRRAPRENMH